MKERLALEGRVMSVVSCKGSKAEPYASVCFHVATCHLSVRKVYSLNANLDRGCTGVFLLMLVYRGLSLVSYVFVFVFINY